MQTNKTLPIGTISHGTLLPEDVIPALEVTLNYVDPDGAQEVAARYADWRELDAEVADWYLEELVDLLDEHVPEYCYVGAHPDDPADIGVWPDCDAAELAIADGDAVRVSDPAEVPAQGTAVFVNDHGNMALYVNGKLAWDCV
jgi:hypothetical protein